MTDLQDLRRLGSIKLSQLKKLKPGIHSELLDFCSSLDEKEFPEAIAITEGRARNLSVFVSICEKLSKKKEKQAQKRLKEAEQLILSIHTLDYGRVTPGPAPVSRPPAKEFERLGQRVVVPAFSEPLNPIARKIAAGVALTPAEAVTFAKEGYGAFVNAVQDPNPLIKGKPAATIIVCSDTRLMIGTGILVKLKLAVKSWAGNASKWETTKGRRIILGHGGYFGCGAVNEAANMHARGKKPEDDAISSITTDSIPAAVALALDPAKANTRYQAQQVKGAAGIHVNIETKQAELVHGKSDKLTTELIVAAEKVLVDSGAMGKQTAGFILITREGRKFPGKNVLNLKPNQGFETNFKVAKDGSVTLPIQCEGSAKYGATHFSKIFLVVDPDPQVVNRAAELLRSKFPDAQLIQLQEDISRRELKEL
ncbi:MAG: hypothetical protein V1492_03020 [Candidatus Micrarchaeota archaeon]